MFCFPLSTEGRAFNRRPPRWWEVTFGGGEGGTTEDDGRAGRVKKTVSVGRGSGPPLTAGRPRPKGGMEVSSRVWGISRFQGAYGNAHQAGTRGDALSEFIHTHTEPTSFAERMKAQGQTFGVWSHQGRVGAM